MSDSVRPNRQQPTRFHCPWDSPGKNTGVGCHFLLQFMKVKSESEVAQSCLTLSDPMDCSLPGSSVHGIFQARVLAQGAIAFSALSLNIWQIKAVQLYFLLLTTRGILRCIVPTSPQNCFQFSKKITLLRYRIVLCYYYFHFLEKEDSTVVKQSSLDQKPTSLDSGSLFICSMLLCLGFNIYFKCIQSL